MSARVLENYVDVPQRIKLFYEKYPEGSLQMDPELLFKEVGDQIIVIGRAFAFRHPGDENPGVGTAQEYLPGKTNFTRGSEIQNLETSCWGRAIGSLGIGIDKAIATREEVELAIERNKPEKIKMRRPNPKAKEIFDLLQFLGHESKEEVLRAVQFIINRSVESSADLTDDEIDEIYETLQEIQQ